MSEETKQESATKRQRVVRSDEEEEEKEKDKSLFETLFGGKSEVSLEDDGHVSVGRLGSSASANTRRFLCLSMVCKFRKMKYGHCLVMQKT